MAHRDGAGNAIGVLEAPGAGPVRELILLGHIDTVRGFPKVIERDGKLYGRGAVDAKGPLAAFATAAAVLGPQPGWRIVVAGAVEEESATSKGARHLAARRRPDLCVIGEPTGWQRMALGYKGRLLADVEFQRMMSHTAGPGRSRARDRVRLLALRAGPGRRAEHRPRAVVGTGAGVVAPLQLRRRRHAGDGRDPDGLPPAAQRRPGGDEALLVSADGVGTFRFSGEESAFRAEKNTPLVRAFVSAVRAYGGEPSFLNKTGTSDMNVVGPAWGCPILAYGPGDSSLDHTPEEHVEIDEWVQRGGGAGGRTAEADAAPASMSALTDPVNGCYHVD